MGSEDFVENGSLTCCHCDVFLSTVKSILELLPHQRLNIPAATLHPGFDRQSKKKQLSLSDWLK